MFLLYLFIYISITNFNLDQKSVRMLVLWLEENIIQKLKPDKRSELQNIDSQTWDTAFENYCISCSSPIKSTEILDHLEWLLGVAVKKSYKEQSKLNITFADVIFFFLMFLENNFCTVYYFFFFLESKYDSETKRTLEVSSNVPMIIPSDNPIDNLDGNYV